MEQPGIMVSTFMVTYFGHNSFNIQKSQLSIVVYSVGWEKKRISENICWFFITNSQKIKNILIAFFKGEAIQIFTFLKIIASILLCWKKEMCSLIILTKLTIAARLSNHSYNS